MYEFDIRAVEEQVLEFMRANGCEPADTSSLELDGKIHRYRVSGDKHSSKNGAYCIFTDGWPAGFIQDWKLGGSISWRFQREHLDQTGKDWFNDERYKEACRISEEHQKQLRAELDAKQQTAQVEAGKLWSSLFIEVNHDFAYLQTKNITGYGVRLLENHIPYGNPHNDELVVPLYNITGVVQSLQFIGKDGEKRFYTGAPVKGAFFSIGLDGKFGNFTPASPILLCEGYATAATIFEATGIITVAAMTAGNLMPVAEALKAKYPERAILILADNDRHKDGSNPGIEKAVEAVKKLGLKGILAPQFKENEAGSDWNDYAAIHGLDATSSLLKEKIRWELMSPQERVEAEAVKRLKVLSRELDKEIQIPPEDFIAGMFPRKRISAVIAAPGTGKTWFLQRTVSDLSIGGTIFDGFAEETSPKTSVVFAGEAGPDMMIRRAAATNWPVGKEYVKIYGMVDAEKNGLSLMLDEDDGKKNIERIIQAYKPDIIFFDTLGSFHNSDENKADEMKPVLRWLLVMAELHNVAIVLMHHSRKMQGKEIGRALTQDDTIGSSIFNRLVSLIVSIEPTKEDEKVLLVKPLKSWFTKFMPFTYKLEATDDDHTQMRIDLAPSAVDEINRTKFNLETMLDEMFKSGQWFKASDIPVEELGVTMRQVRRILTEFVNMKKLRMRGENKGREYSLP